MEKQKRFLIEEKLKEKKNLAAINTEISGIKTDKKGAKGELRALRQEQEKALQKKADIEEQLRELQRKKQALTAQDDGVQQTINQRTEELDAFRSEQGVEFLGTQEFQNAHQRQWDIRNRANEVDEQLAAEQREVARLTEDLGQAHRMIENEFEGYKQHHAQPDHYHAGDEAEHDEKLKDYINNHHNKDIILGTYQDLKAAQDRVSQLETQKEEVAEHVREAERNYGIAESNNKDVACHRGASLEEISKLERQKEDLAQKLEVLQKEEDGLVLSDEEIESIEARIKQKEKQIEALKNTCIIAKGKKEGTEQEIARLDQTLGRIKPEFEKHKKDLEAV